MAIPDFHGELGTEGTDHIVETGLLGHHTSGGELGLDLSEPDLVGQKSGSLMLTVATVGTVAGRSAPGT